MSRQSETRSASALKVVAEAKPRQRCTRRRKRHHSSFAKCPPTQWRTRNPLWRLEAFCASGRTSEPPKWGARDFFLRSQPITSQLGADAATRIVLQIIGDDRIYGLWIMANTARGTGRIERKMLLRRPIRAFCTLSSVAAATLSLTLFAQTVIACNAADFFEGLGRYARFEYRLAIEILRPLADGGDPVTQELLGNMYSRPHGIEGDQTAALYWYGRAGQQGRVEAQFELGKIFRDGLGTAVDGKLAVFWFSQAAKRGAPHAFGALGEMYLGHPDLPEDNIVAREWFRKGAQLDNAAAMYNLGLIYHTGRGVVQDEVEAHKWLDLSARRAVGRERDIALLALSRIAERLTPAQVKIAKDRARIFWLDELQAKSLGID